MEEVKNKQPKKTTNTSKVQKSNRVKKEVSNLSNDDLMEQILNKKKEKKRSSTSSVKKNNTPKKTSTSKAPVKKKEETISNDVLYEKIKAKKNNKKKKTSPIKKEDNVQSVKSEGIETNIIDTLEVDKNLTIEELEKRYEESIENDVDVKNETLSTSVEDEQIKEGVHTTEEVETLKKEENLSEDSKSKTLDIHKKKKYEDLIITREITFTADNLDLKDEEILKELRDAIDEFDSLDETIPKEIEDIPDDFVTITEQKKRKNKKIRLNKNEIKIIFGLLLVLIIMIIAIVFVIHLDDGDNAKIGSSVKKEEITDNLLQKYEECLNRPLNESDQTEDVLLAKKELDSYLESKYDASVMYEDLSFGYTYAYNTDEVYYAASTIKALDALYIYTKAFQGELNLDDTMTYSSKYKVSSSRAMKKHKYGDKISLRTLVEYAITVSDNSAHQMLVSYIGKKNLKEFGKSLGAKNTLVGSDNFGRISTEDAIIYMKEINKLINESGEMGEELKSYFLEADQNGLEFEDLRIQAIHKYGEYKEYYHDIGIVYTDKPYAVAILTYEGKDDFLEIVKDINSRVYKLHNIYYSSRENICSLEVYGTKKSVNQN